MFDTGFNPYRNRWLKVKPPKEIPELSSVAALHADSSFYETDFIDLVTSCEAREITGNDAKNAAAEVFGRMPYAYRFWLMRLFNKKVKFGVGKKTVEALFPGLIPKFGCYLCKEYKGWPLKVPHYAEPKMDGLRTIIITDPEEPVALSRNGKPLYGMEHIIQILLEASPYTVFDGEGFGSDWSTSMSSLKTQKGSASDAKFWVFDQLPLHEFRAGKSKLPLSERKRQLHGLLSLISSDDIVEVPYHKFIDEADIDKYKIQFLNEGFEGMIGKKCSSKYKVSDKRNNDWFKAKDVYSDEFPIIGVKEGREGTKLEGSLGAFIVDVDGTEVRVGGGMSEEEREEYWDSWHSDDNGGLMGAMVEVFYQPEKPSKENPKGLTDKGSLKFNRVKCIRWDKTE